MVFEKQRVGGVVMLLDPSEINRGIRFNPIRKGAKKDQKPIAWQKSTWCFEQILKTGIKACEMAFRYCWKNTGGKDRIK